MPLRAVLCILFLGIHTTGAFHAPRRFAGAQSPVQGRGTGYGDTQGSGVILSSSRYGNRAVDNDRRMRSPGLQNNFYDQARDDFRRPYGRTPGSYGSTAASRGAQRRQNNKYQLYGAEMQSQNRNNAYSSPVAGNNNVEYTYGNQGITGSSLPSQFQMNYSNQGYTAVYGLILINLALFLADKVLQIPINPLYLLHTDWAWYQPLTACFCHASFAHLIGNVLPLLLFGRAVENDLGRGGLLFSYAFCGVIANLVSLLVLPAETVSAGASGAVFGLFTKVTETVTLGASGAVFGIFAVSTLAKLSWRDAFDWRKLVEVAVLAVSMTVLVDIQTAAKAGVAGINHVAHLSGALAGAFMVWMLRSSALPRLVDLRQRLVPSKWPGWRRTSF